MEVYTLKEYTNFVNGLGIYDEFQIRISYKLYLAMEKGDLEELKKANLTNWYNAYYRSLGCYN